jgi:glycine dehydrogenase subunit 1
MACTKIADKENAGKNSRSDKDVEGKRGFVSTLQTREQHIRREKATSNICSNQALNALAASVYLTTMGKQGLQEVARQCYDKAHYAASVITASGKYRLAYERPFFKEFPIIVQFPMNSYTKHSFTKGIIGGYAA